MYFKGSWFVGVLPALYHPKLMCLVAGLWASQSEKRLIMKLAKSVSRCAASVAIARLFAKRPPTISMIMNTRQSTLAKMSFLLAIVSTAASFPL